MTTDSVPAHNDQKITDEQRWAAEDAVRFAMEGAQGGAVPSIPRGHGARSWGEADGYWITLHVGPVLDALIKLGWGPDQSSLLATARADQMGRDAQWLRSRGLGIAAQDLDDIRARETGAPDA